MMNELLTGADMCVKCGLCLPYCPTYTHTQDENESPRGRIALIQAWAGGKLPTSEKLLGHIDNCLLCRSCERVCPAVVPYGRLLDSFRNQVRQERKSSLRVALLNKVAQNQNARSFAKKSLRFYQASHLQATVRFLKLPQLLRFQSLERLLPEYREPSSDVLDFYPASGNRVGSVGLFVGCLGEWLDQKTVQAAIQVLTAVGYDVHIPKQQKCCGALALHDGDLATSVQLAADNVGVFGGLDVEAIISIASGCGSQLREYQDSSFAAKVMDISQFLSKVSDRLSSGLKPLSKTVCVHSPCSLRNILRSEQSVIKLLQLIPDIQLAPLPETAQCCGAAGSFVLDHPMMAKTLVNTLLDTAVQKPIDLLVSSNIGCALHIVAGLRERGMEIEVIHPVVLLARQLG